VVEEQATDEPVVRELLCATAASLLSLRAPRAVEYYFAGGVAGIIASASRRREW
jgi:hypothetical protein